MSDTLKHREGFWSMVCMLALHVVQAPLWAMIGLTAGFGLVWAMSAYAEHLGVKLYREYPDLMRLVGEGKSMSVKDPYKGQHPRRERRSMDECNHYWLPIYYPVTPAQEQRFCLDNRPYARCTMCGATRSPQPDASAKQQN